MKRENELRGWYFLSAIAFVTSTIDIKGLGKMYKWVGEFLAQICDKMTIKESVL